MSILASHYILHSNTEKKGFHSFSAMLLSFIFIHCSSEEETALAEAIAAPPKYEAINMRMIAK